MVAIRKPKDQRMPGTKTEPLCVVLVGLIAGKILFKI